MTQPPWKCELCGRGDNATRHRNGWLITVSGEMGADDPEIPDLGVDVDPLDHHIEVCDRCTRRADLVAALLELALRVERASKRCPCCQSKLTEGGACPHGCGGDMGPFFAGV